LAESKMHTTNTKLYRFEKEQESAVSLAALLIGGELSKRARQRRPSGPPVKIKAHGRRERHV